MARTQANPKQQKREVVLSRGHWTKRQLDLFESPAPARLANPNNPYAQHLLRMRAMREQEARA